MNIFASIGNLFTSFFQEAHATLQGLEAASGSGHLWVLILALAVACGFELINGFHDTANAVATVIYTRSLKPTTAVIWSGICNFIGVFLGGTAVAMGILKLLPTQALAMNQMDVSMALVFALLLGAIIWNFGTWYLGLPASSSHTLIGAILGIGFVHSLMWGIPLSQGVNWSKAADIGISLFVSPLFGFSFGAILLWGAKRLLKDKSFHQPPAADQTPPWKVRGSLILTCTGVSLAHGSNDGQKGVGLIMLILLTIMPGQFALRTDLNNEGLKQTVATVADLENRFPEARPTLIANTPKFKSSNKYAKGSAGLTDGILIRQAQAQSTSEPKEAKAIRSSARKIRETIAHVVDLPALTAKDRILIRTELASLEKNIGALEKSGAGSSLPDWAAIQRDRKALKSIVDYAPTWVLVIVALSLGMGTMIGWRRIVVTLGEKIGKNHMTYAQGASAELVAMSTIGVAAIAGLPVSTTHVLSSGIAGTMVANKSGVQPRTIRSIALAWLLTLPASMTLSGSLYWLFTKIIT